VGGRGVLGLGLDFRVEWAGRHFDFARLAIMWTCVLPLMYINIYIYTVPLL